MKIGIDIIEISRFEELVNDENKLKKIFTLTEIKYNNKFSDRITHFSGNFCAKEAFVKALKTGFSNGITPKDVEILHTEKGVPYVNINNEKLKKIIKNDNNVDISISHSKIIATAICIIDM